MIAGLATSRAAGASETPGPGGAASALGGTVTSRETLFYFFVSFLISLIYSLNSFF
jgi:hypothetical protein